MSEAIKYLRKILEFEHPTPFIQKDQFLYNANRACIGEFKDNISFRLHPHTSGLVFRRLRQFFNITSFTKDQINFIAEQILNFLQDNASKKIENIIITRFYDDHLNSTIPLDNVLTKQDEEKVMQIISSQFIEPRTLTRKPLDYYVKDIRHEIVADYTDRTYDLEVSIDLVQRILNRIETEFNARVLSAHDTYVVAGLIDHYISDHLSIFECPFRTLTITNRKLGRWGLDKVTYPQPNMIRVRRKDDY